MGAREIVEAVRTALYDETGHLIPEKAMPYIVAVVNRDLNMLTDEEYNRGWKLGYDRGQAEALRKND